MLKRVFCIFLLVVFLYFNVMQSFANSQIQDAQNKKKKLEQQISGLKYKEKLEKKNLSWNEKRRKKIIEALRKRGLKDEEIEQQIELLKSAIESLEDSVAKAQEDYLAQKELFKVRLRVFYKNSRSTYAIEEILNCKNLNEFFTKVKAMKVIAAADKHLIEQMKNTQKEIEALKKKKENEVENFIKEAEDNRREMDKLEVSRAKIEEEIRKNRNRVWYYIKQEDELLKISKDLENLIKNLKTNSEKYVGGNMVWPVPSSKKISSYFGMRLHPIYKVWKMHTGIDIHAKYGSYIIAANTGTVIFAGWRGGYGNAVIIDHGGGISTLYAHIKPGGILVRLGTKVNAGQTIAKVGTTGLSTGPHLHFEVRKNGKPQNPLKYVSATE